MRRIEEKIRKLYLSLGIIKLRKYVNESICNDQIVLVRLDAIGDFIMSYSVLLEYRKLFYDKKIVLICTALCGELALKWNLADEVIQINMKSYLNDRKYRKIISSELRQIRAEKVIQLVSHRTVEMEHLTGLICSNKKIALCSDREKSLLRIGWKGVYSELLKEKKNKFEIHKNFDLLNAVGQVNKTACQAVLPITGRTFKKSRKYFVLAPGGSFRAKKWEAQNYAAIASYIIKKYMIDCYILGSNEDVQDNESIYNAVAYHDRVINLTNKTSIEECIEVIRNGEIVITNDTCFVHIAVAVNTKSVCIAGGWHWGRFVPYDLPATNNIYHFPLVAYQKMQCYNCDFQTGKCRWIKENREKKLPCIEEISVLSVLDLIDKAMNY